MPYGWTGLTKDIFLETVDVLFEEIFPEIIVQYLPEAFFSFFFGEMFKFRDGIIYSLQPHRRQPTRLPRPWDSPGKNTGVGCHFLLQLDQANCSPPISPFSFV